MTKNTMKLILNLGLYATCLGIIIHYSQCDHFLSLDFLSSLSSQANPEDMFKAVQAESQSLGTESFKIGKPLPPPTDQSSSGQSSPPQTTTPSGQLIPVLQPVRLDPDQAMKKMEADLEADLSRQRNRKIENEKRLKSCPPSAPSTKQDSSCDTPVGEGYVTQADVQAALAASKKKSPSLYEDSIRVWRNFKMGKSDPHYSYRYWAKDLITWLRMQKGYVFNKQDKVAAVFRIVQKIEHISVDAALLLTNDVWGYFVYREVLPDAHKAPPEHQKEEQPKKEITT